MANDKKRVSLRGLECSILDVVCAGAGTEQWAEWLRVPLQHAAAMGDLRLVIELQRAGASGDVLHAALKGGQAALARDLVRLGASVIGKFESGDSPLHLAAALGHEDCVALMLEKGALPNLLDSADRAPLHLAAAKGRLAVVNVLLAAGADTRARYGKDDNSALDLAAAKGHVEIVTALIRSGVDVNAADFTGYTALHKAAYGNKAGVIDVLVEEGADTAVAKHSQCCLGWMPLHCACDSSCSEAVVALLKNGAPVQERDSAGLSPLHMAVREGDLPSTVALLAAGADVDARDDIGETALHLAAGKGHEGLLRSLLQAGANVDATNSAGTSALHHAAAARENSGTATRVLVEAGATPDMWSEEGQTPLHWCCTFNESSLEAMTALLEGGANPNEQEDTDYSTSSPLHLTILGESSIRDTENAVNLLLRWGADETATDCHGQTPLEFAKEVFGAHDLVRLEELLTQAPFDRNWRRRAWLLLYRAYPRRMVLIPGTGAARQDRAKKCRSGSVSTEAGGGASVVRGEAAEGIAGGGGVTQGDWSGVVTRLVGMELEGIFRNIVKYL